GFSLPITRIHSLFSVIGNLFFLEDHSFSSLPNLVGSSRHIFHLVSLFPRSNGQIVSILGSAVNLVELPASERAVDYGGYHSQTSKADDQFVVKRNCAPSLPQGALLGWAVVAAGISCIGTGSYWLLLGACFGCRRLHCLLAAAVLVIGVGI